MEKPNPIKEKSFNFAVEVVLFCTMLKELKHYELSTQLIRSGTSIGANVEEAIEAFSRKDFAYRMSVAARESRETLFWLRVIRKSGLIKEEQINPLIRDASEIKRILVSIVKTTQESLR